MQLFTEMQVRLHKLRRTSGSKGPTSSASAGETWILSLAVFRNLFRILCLSPLFSCVTVTIA